MTALTDEAVAGYAYGAGLRGEALVIAVAIAHPESGLDPTKINDNAQTGDLSYSLWQINMRGSLGPARRKQFGISRNEQLLDPATNARAMYIVSSGGTNWTPWTTFRNRKHLPYMAQARAAAKAVEARGGNAGGTGSLPSVDGGSSAAVDLGRSSDIIGAAPGGIRSSYRADLMGNGFIVRGKPMSRSVLAEVLLGGTVELTTDEVSELSVDLSPDGLDDWEVATLIGIGTPVDWFDLRLESAGISWGATDDVASFSVQLRSAGAERMRKRRDIEATWSGRSPTEVMAERAFAADLRFVGEGSQRRDQIVRAGRGEDGADPETDWDLGQRLARELGYWSFEAGGVLYFARPSWLAARMPRFSIHAGRGLRAPSDGVADRGGGLQGWPSCSRTKADDLTGGLPPRTITLPLERNTGEQVRPGMVVDFDGVPFFKGGYIVTRVSWPIDGGIEAATIEAIDPVDPTPQPAADELDPGEDPVAAAQQNASSSPGVPSGTGSSLDMVTVALKQVGDAYIYGAETDPSDPDPDTFDCSELIQWACAQVGVTFVDGSSNQIAAVARAGRERTVTAASRIRGALLWTSGHVAISLGDGVHTVEARGRRYGVVQATIAGRFTRAGLIPGLRYPSGS